MFHAKSLEGAVRSDARVLGHLIDLYLCDECGFKSSVGDTSRIMSRMPRGPGTAAHADDIRRSSIARRAMRRAASAGPAGRFRSDLTST